MGITKASKFPQQGGTSYITLETTPAISFLLNTYATMSKLKPYLPQNDVNPVESCSSVHHFLLQGGIS